MSVKSKVSLFLAAATISILTFPHDGVPLDIRLDPSWVAAMNYFFIKSYQFGSDVLFPHGPLSFLIAPVPLGHNLLLGIAFSTVCQFLFIWTYLRLSDVPMNVKAWKPLSIITLLSYLCNSQHILIGIILMNCLIYLKNKENIFLYISILFLVMAFLIKISLGLMGALIVTAFVFFDSTLTKKESIIILLKSALMTALLFLVFWFSFYGNLNGISKHFYSAQQFSNGYSSAMSIILRHSWGLIVLSFLSFLLIGVWRTNTQSRLFFVAIFFSTVLIFKYAFVRGEGRLADLFVYLILFFFIYYARLRSVKPVHVFFFTIFCLAFWTNLYGVGYGFISPRVSPENRTNFHEILCAKDLARGIKNFSETVIHYSSYEQKLQKTSRHNLQPKILAPEYLSLLGNSTVDFYPWELSYAFANNLNYHPRPIIQSYPSFTPWLDNQNAEFMRSAKRPQFILWQLDETTKDMYSIDGRYLLNDEPLTVFEILSRYKLVRQDPEFLILETAEASLQKSLFPEGVTFHWNEWVKVPSRNEKIIRAQISVSRPLIAKLKRLFYKENPVYIDYLMADDTITTHRLIVDNAVSGVWISPYVTDVTKIFSGIEVKAIRLFHFPSDFYDKKINLTWEIIQKTS